MLGYEKMLDEKGREMHSSWGNTIDAPDAFARMGADVMRWQFCPQPPIATSCSASGRARDQAQAAHALELGLVPRHLRGHRELRAPFRRPVRGPTGAPLRPLDHWLLARTQAFLSEAADAYESFLTGVVTRAFESFVDDVSNWYIRRSRRRFWEESDEAAFRTLWYALVQSLRAISPIMPFLAEHLWQALVAGAAPDAPESVFLAGWPAPNPRSRTTVSSRRWPRRGA